MKAEKIDTISLKIPHSFIKEIDAVAKKQDRTRSAVIRRVLQDYLEEIKEAKDAEKILKEYEKNPNKKFYTLQDLMKNLGISKKDLESIKDNFSDCD